MRAGVFDEIRCGGNIPQMKILTISVAAYNAEGWLSRCIDSLTKTDVSNELDIVVVNDGSTDQTLSIARSYEERFPGVVNVVDKPNGGHGSTINAAIDVARGTYFKVVDSDDWVERDGIEKLVAVLRSLDADVVVNPFYIVDADTGQKRLTADEFIGHSRVGEVLSIDDVLADVPFAMHSFCFKTSILKSSPCRMDEHCFYVDNEYDLYYFGACATLAFLDFPVYDYLLGTSEQSMNMHNMVKRRDQHEKVCSACIDYYDSLDLHPGKKQKILKNGVLRLIDAQYRILLCLPYSECKSELRQFDGYLKKKSPELYEDFLGRYGDTKVGKTVRYTRLTDFHQFRALNALCRRKYMSDAR